MSIDIKPLGRSAAMRAEAFHKLPSNQRNTYVAEATREYHQEKSRERSSLQLKTEFVPAYQKGLVSLTGAELLEREFPPREILLSPLLPSKGLAMLFAERGVGKTWIALNIGHAIAGGGMFLRWQAPLPRRVCYVDGEMPGSALQERYASIVANSEFDAPEANFRLIAADMQDDGLPDLADPTAQHFFDDAIQDAELIIVDNLSTICRSLRENEADSFGAVQAWLIRQRAAGRSVLLVHHAGKAGDQRGSSKKEDVLDTVVRLRRPINYNASDGAHFEIHYLKSRNFYGDDALPFEARLADGKWTVSEIVSANGDEAIQKLRDEGMSIRDIAERLGMSKSAVSRKLNGGQ